VNEPESRISNHCRRARALFKKLAFESFPNTKSLQSTLLHFIANRIVELANTIYTSCKDSFRVPILNYKRIIGACL
jgi:hypothetical protein